MKKSFYSKAVVVLCGVFLALLSGCSKDRKDGSLDPNSKDIHIRVWESNNGPNEFIKQAGAIYHQSHPNIFIDYICVDVDYATQHIKEDGPLGVGADIFAAPHDKLGDLVTSGCVLPTVNPESIEKTVLSSCAKAINYNGVMYGYPVCAETYALFYNKKLIKENEVPTTWEALEQWTQKFNSENPGKKGFVMDVSNAYYGITFMTGDNNHLFGEYGTDKSTPNINTPYAIKMVTYMQSLRHSLGLEDIQLTTSSCDGLFVSGHAAMHVTGLWNVKKFEGAGVNFGVTTLPALPGQNKPSSSFSGTRVMFVSSWSKHPEEAADFATFLLTPEMQELRYKINGTMPAINIKVNDAYMDGFLKQLEYAFPMPSIPEMNKFWSYMGNTLYAIWTGEDPKTELDKCYTLFEKN